MQLDKIWNAKQYLFVYFSDVTCSSDEYRCSDFMVSTELNPLESGSGIFPSIGFFPTCIGLHRVCNGVEDCANGDDEDPARCIGSNCV